MAPPEKSYRLPQQARSRQKFDRLLEAAANLFAEQGVDQVTTNHIAAAAGVSVGSLYQYFPNKEAVIEALVDRYLAAIGDVFPAEIDTRIPIESIIRTVITGFVRFSRKHRGFQLVMIGLEGTSNASTSAAMQERIVHGIERVLAAYYPDLAPEKRKLCAAISFSLVAGIMPHDLPEETMVEQMLLATVAYQRAFLAQSSPLS